MKKALRPALFVSFVPVLCSKYTQKDRDNLFEMSAKMHKIVNHLKQIDKRFDFQQNIFIGLVEALIGSRLLVDYITRRREAIYRQAFCHPSTGSG